MFEKPGYTYTPAQSQEVDYLLSLLEQSRAQEHTRVVATILTHYSLVENPDFTGNTEAFYMEERYILGEPHYLYMTVTDVTSEPFGVCLWGNGIDQPIRDYLLFANDTYAIAVDAYPEVTIYIETKQ